MSRAVAPIAVVLPDLFDAGGGIARISRALVKAICEWAFANGAEVEVHVLRDSGARRDVRYLPEPARYRGYAGDRTRLAAAVIGAAWRGRRVVFGHVNLAALALAFPPTCDVVVVAHGIEVWSRLRLERRLALRRARVWAVSRFTADLMIAAQGLRAERVQVIPNALDPLWPLPASPRPGGKHLLAVARLDPSDAYKGIDLTLAALARLADPPPLVVVGDGADRARLEALAQTPVTFTGAVDDATLQRLYADASAFVLPSTGEGFGLVYLEAMAHALPVIGARAGGTPEVVAEGVTGVLIAPGDRDALAHAITTIDPAMGQAGRARAERDFLYPRYAADIARALTARGA